MSDCYLYCSKIVHDEVLAFRIDPKQWWFVTNYAQRLKPTLHCETVHEDCRQPMAISAVSATLEASGCPTPGRMEKMTSLMTCEIRPCCASMAIFVLRARIRQKTIRIYINYLPVFHTLRQLVILSFLFFLFLLLLSNPQRKYFAKGKDYYLASAAIFISRDWNHCLC